MPHLLAMNPNFRFIEDLIVDLIALSVFAVFSL